MSGGLQGAFKAELVKLRGSLAAWICFLAPTVVVLLFVAQMLLVQVTQAIAPTPAEAWVVYFQGLLGLWAFLMLPLYVTLQSALLASLEHSNHQWKYLLALPVARRHHYVAKLGALALLLVISTGVLCLAALSGGLLLAAARPELGIAHQPAWAYLVRHASGLVAASGIMVAVQFWVAVRWSSFSVAIGFGIAAAVAGVLIGQSDRLGPWYPWTMPMHTLTQTGTHLNGLAMIGFLGGTAIAAAGIYALVRREST